MKPPVLLKSGRALVKGKRRGQFFVFDSKAHGREDYRVPGHLGFTSLVFNALTGNAKPLRDLLLSNPALSDENWEDIVWLIDTLLARTPGRPHTKGAVWDAEWWIAWQIEMIFKPKWRADNKRKNVKDDDKRKEIERLIPLAEARYPEAKGLIDIEHIIGSMLKGGSKRLRKN
jgi:hypothetical protein